MVTHGLSVASAVVDSTFLASSRTGPRWRNHVARIAGAVCAISERLRLPSVTHRRALARGAVRPTALLTDKYELTMLAAALRDGTAHRSSDVRGVRPAAAGRPPLRRRRRHRTVRGSVAAVQVRRRRARHARRLPRSGHHELSRRLPVPRRRRRLPGGRAVLSRLAGAVGARHLRRVRAPGDAGAVDPQPRHARSRRRRPAW